MSIWPADILPNYKGKPKWANINQFTYFSPNKSHKMSLIIDFLLHEIFILLLEYESMANVDLLKAVNVIYSK